MTRVFEQLDVITEDLRARANDWAQWDETYTYLAGENQSYLETNVSYEALTPFELVHIAFFDRQKKLVNGFQMSSTERSLIDISPATIAAISEYPSIAKFLNNPGEDSLSGLVMLDGQPLFIALAAVTDNERKTASNGFLLFTRAFSDSLKSQIAKRTKLPIQFLPPTPLLPSNTISLATTESEITARSTIRDIENRGISDVSFSSTRDIYHQGKTSRNVMVALMALFLVIANAILLLFLNRVVLGRLQKFAVRIKAIALTRDFSVRVPIDGRDEISDLTRTFNALVETTERSTTQLTEARNQAMRADAAKSAFVAHVSHELRTPIHSLSGILRILLKSEPEGSRQNLIQIAREAATTLLSTINDILDLSKIESGSLELQNVDYSLRKILHNSLRHITSRIEEKGQVSLRFHVAPGIPDKLRGDPLRLQQILTNLLGNAAKFTHHGAITLEVEPGRLGTEPAIAFKVSDTGIGIAPDRMESVFEPYRQADSSIQARFAGTGLGLSIVRQIVSQLGGTISVQSVLHEGSVFTVTLPLTAKEESIEHRSYPPHRTLIIAENEESGRWFAAKLQTFGSSAEFILDTAPLSTCNTLASRVSLGSILVLRDGYHTVESLERAKAIAHSLNTRLFITVGDSDLTALNTVQDDPKLKRCPTPLSAEEFLSQVLNLQMSSEPLKEVDSLRLSESLPRMNLLVADDAPTSQLILRDLLEEAGHSVTIARDGEELTRFAREALEQPGKIVFDAIITDIEMPRLTGLEAAAEIRALEARHQSSPPIPIIALTAHALSEQRERMLQSGIDFVLSKPITPQALEEVLRTAVSEPISSSLLEPRTESHERHLVNQLMSRSSSRSRTTSEAAGPIDIADVFERSGESLRRTKLIMRSFLDAYDTPTEALKASVERGELSEAVIPAHSIKGLLLDVGAREAAETAASLEAASRAGDLERAVSAFDKLRKQLPSIVNVIEEILRHDVVIQSKRSAT